MTLTKDEYVLNRLSKIRHKKWELFVITRIVHRLDDPEIEFVCQQYVKRKDGNRALTDLFFPQFGIHLEIDEGQHAEKAHQKSDALRSQDIIDATGHEILRIKVYSMDGKTNRPLRDISQDADEFVAKIKKEKARQLSIGLFEPWDFDAKFNADAYLKQGYIDVMENVVFRYQHDALRCFGYTGKAYQRGAWTIKSDKRRNVWFPRLYETKDWNNSLSDDEQQIVEQRVSGEPVNENHANIEKWDSRIVFARYHDELGARLYRFVGEFQFDESASSPVKSVFRRISTRVDTIPPHTGT